MCRHSRNSGCRLQKPEMTVAYAGVYADLDFQSLRPLDDILQGKKVAMGKMQDDVDEWQHALPNAFMASVPGHDFWLFVMQIITERTATEEMRYNVTSS